MPDQPPQNASEPEDQSETTPNDRVLENVTVEDCQIPTSVEPDAQEQETQSQAWADSPEENPFEAGSEKPQDDSSSEPATPKSVQRQILGTDTEISDDKPSISRSIWGDNITDCSSKPEIKVLVVYCSLCRDNSHPEEGCTASIIKKANKKALSAGDSKKTGKGKITFKKFKSDLDLVVMRGRNTDSVQYIWELKESELTYAVYLFFTYGDYARAEKCDFLMLGNRVVMDHWKRLSKTMDKSAAEDHLREVYNQI